MKLNDELDRAYERLLVIRAQDPRPATLFASWSSDISGELLYYIRRVLGDGSESFDVLQEVWLRVFMKLTSVASTGGFSRLVIQDRPR